MTREEFFAKFELFAELPGAVAKMRELILRLAIRGQLVEQRVADGNAKDIFSEPASTTFRESSPRYATPPAWLWVPFASVGEQRLGKMLDQKGNRGELKPYLRNTNVQWMRFELGDVKQLRLAANELEEYRLRDGDLLICEGGEPGRCAIWRNDVPEMYFQKALHRVRPRVGILSEYLAIHLRVDAESGVLAEHFTGATIKHLTGRSLAEYCIAIPPLAEQKRIVAKVDELMALCDQLEEQQKERETRHAALARASLSRFTAAPSPANLTCLFHSSYAIAPEDLRRVVLSLAMRGLLITRDRTQTPEAVKAGVAHSGAPFQLPETWQWVPLGEVTQLINGDRSKNYPNKAEYVRDGVAWINTGHIEPDGTLSIESMHYISRTKFESLRSGKIRRGDLVYCLRGATLGKTAVITQFDEGAVASSLVIIRPASDVDSRFAYRFLTSPLGREQISKFDNGSAQPNLSANNVKKYHFPLPPLAEQQRISEKIDELMQLVDDAESQLARSAVTAKQLLNALVAELASG